MLDGKLFQSRGAAAANVLSPKELLTSSRLRLCAPVTIQCVVSGKKSGKRSSRWLTSLVQSLFHLCRRDATPDDIL